VRLRSTTHQRAETQPGVPGPVTGNGRPVVPAVGQQLLQRTGRQHHAGRLQGPAGQGNRVQGREHHRRVIPVTGSHLAGHGHHERVQHRYHGHRVYGHRRSLPAAPGAGFRLKTS